MIRHIVLFKMKEDAGEVGANDLIDALDALKVKTGGLMVECRAAHDVVRAKNSFDVVLDSVFRNKEDLEKYRVHPEHVKVLDLIGQLCASTVKIDYDISPAN